MVYMRDFKDIKKEILDDVNRVDHNFKHEMSLIKHVKGADHNFRTKTEWIIFMILLILPSFIISLSHIMVVMFKS
jgi:hypothetical protein